MKNFIIAGFLLLSSVAVVKDQLLKGNWYVYDSNGKKIEYFRKDKLIDGLYYIEGKDGKRTGVIRIDQLLKDRYKGGHKK